MSEQKLRESFENMRPSDEARARMLNNILAAHAQNTTAQAATDRGVSTSGPGQTETRGQVYDFSAQQPTGPGVYTNSTSSVKKSGKKFSFFSYALPIAACLLFAAIVPLASPTITKMLAGVSGAGSDLTQSGSYAEVPSDGYEGDNAAPDSDDNDSSSDGSNSSVHEEPLPSDTVDNAPGEVPTEIPTQTPAPADSDSTPSTEPTDETPIIIDESPTYLYEAPESVVDEPIAPVSVDEPVTYLAANDETKGLTVEILLVIVFSSAAVLAALIIAIVGICAWRKQRS